MIFLSQFHNMTPMEEVEYVLQLSESRVQESRVDGLPEPSESAGTDEGRDQSPPQANDQTATTGMAGRVSYCESGNRNVDNPVSSASGYFQFIDSTWTWVTDLPPPAKAYSYETQLEAFYKLWDGGNGAHHWNPSRYCWSHTEPWNHYDR